MERNQAVDGLQSLFLKANRDLSEVHSKLHKEFQQIYPDHANPMKLVARLKKIEEEMSSLKDQCSELLTAKQYAHLFRPLFEKTPVFYEDLIDKARTLLVGNRTMLQRLQASTGGPTTSDEDDSAYLSFNQIIDEWATQVKSSQEDEEEPGSNNINQLLFSAIVQSN